MHHYSETMNYLFVINELSGGRKNKIQREFYLKNLQEKITRDTFFEDKEVYYMSIVNPYFNQQDVIDLIIEKNITHVILGGGDGTFQRILNLIYEQNKSLFNVLTFGFLPLGSGNGFAYHLKSPRTSSAVIRMLKQNKVKKIDALLINEKEICVHNVGSGFDAKIVSLFQQHKMRGAWLYTKLTLTNLFRMKGYEYTVCADEKTWKLKASLVLVTNSNQFGAKFKIAPFASLEDGVLDLVIIPYQPFHLLFVHFLDFIFFPTHNDSIKNQKIIYWQSKKVSITNHDNAPVQISGDMMKHNTDQIVCEILPAYLQCLY